MTNKDLMWAISDIQNEVYYMKSDDERVVRELVRIYSILQIMLRNIEQAKNVNDNT